MSKGYVNNIIMFDTVTIVTINVYPADTTHPCASLVYFLHFLSFLFSVDYFPIPIGGSYHEVN